MLNETTPCVRRHAAWLLSLKATADGDPRQAHKWLCAMGELERRDVLSRLWPDLADEPQLVRMALAVDDRELAESAVARREYRSERNPGVWSLAATAAHTSGLVNGDTDKLSEAVSLFKRSPRPLALAAAYEDLGLAQQRQGMADSGADALTQALVLFPRAGATTRCSAPPKLLARARNSPSRGERREATQRVGGDDKVRAGHRPARR